MVLLHEHYYTAFIEVYCHLGVTGSVTVFQNTFPYQAEFLLLRQLVLFGN